MSTRKLKKLAKRICRLWRASGEWYAPPEVRKIMNRAGVAIGYREKSSFWDIDIILKGKMFSAFFLNDKRLTVFQSCYDPIFLAEQRRQEFLQRNVKIDWGLPIDPEVAMRIQYVNS